MTSYREKSWGRGDVLCTAHSRLAIHAYAEEFNLAVLEPTDFNNTYVLVMTQAKSDELGIKSDFEAVILRQ